jgi:hypothetical protein
MNHRGLVMFGLAAYILFFLTFVYLVVFVARMPPISPSIGHLSSAVALA